MRFASLIAAAVQRESGRLFGRAGMPGSNVRALKESRMRFSALIAVSLGVIGCGSSEDRAKDAWGIPEECQGFPLEGLRYSPGGEQLPNRCEPFHPTTNNPYAVRCIDALPAYQTPYAGDEYCILPPHPDHGVQLGVHPQGAHYWDEMYAGDMRAYFDTARTSAFEVAAGSEVIQNYTTTTPNTERRFYYRVDARMRSGSHHLGTFVYATPFEEGWMAGSANVTDSLGFIDGRQPVSFLFNAQRPDSDRPSGSLAIPEEDAGLASVLEARQGLAFNLHHFNVSDRAVLREVWLNVWWVPEAEATRQIDELIGLAPVSVPPNTVVDLHSSMTASGETRILSLFGHRHAWTTRFHAWVERAEGGTELVYDSYDWKEMPTYAFNSEVDNPAPNEASSSDGAASGLLLLKPGDQLHFNCHVDTTSERAARLAVPVPNNPLVFGNQAYDAEMCILNGQTVGAPLGVLTPF